MQIPKNGGHHALEDFIILVYSVVDDWFSQLPRPLRQRGYPPAFTDAEVVTLEMVAEYMGFDQDKQAWQYFNQRWRNWFPCLPSRSSYGRQCANLRAAKQQLQAALCWEMGATRSSVHRVDGFPMKLCHFKRAPRCRLFAGEAAPGLPEGDKGFIRPVHQEELRQRALNLQTPLRRNMKDERPPEPVKEFMRGRRSVETVIGQLTERFNIQKLRARDTWHLTVRMTRKILSHTMAVFLNQALGRPHLQIAGLVC